MVRLLPRLADFVMFWLAVTFPSQLIQRSLLNLTLETR
jgi:hypothetical protein